MYIIQRSFDPFVAAGMTQTATYDQSGRPVEATPSPEVTQTPEPTPTPEAAATPEVAPTPEPTPAPAPTVDIESIIKGKFDGKFSSLDELAEAYRSAEEQAKRDPFASDWIRNLNKAVSEGVDPSVYMEVSNVDIDKLSEADAIILQMRWKEGLSREDAEFLVNRKYRLGGDDEVDPSDPDVREAAINLKLEGKNAKEFLGKYKQEALTSPLEKRQAELKSAWKPVIPSVLDKYKTFSVEGKTGKYDFPVSPEIMGKAQELLNSVLDSGMFDNMPDREGMEYAEAIVRNEILSNMVAQMLDTVADQYKQAHLVDKHNPRKPESMERAPVQSSQDGMIDFLKKAHGITR